MTKMTTNATNHDKDDTETETDSVFNPNTEFTELLLDEDDEEPAEEFGPSTHINIAKLHSNVNETDDIYLTFKRVYMDSGDFT